MKKCSACGETKSFGDYTKNASKNDGLNHNCRDCQRQYTRDHYRANKARYLERTERNRELYLQERWEVLAPLKAKPFMCHGLRSP